MYGFNIYSFYDKSQIDMISHFLNLKEQRIILLGGLIHNNKLDEYLKDFVIFGDYPIKRDPEKEDPEYDHKKEEIDAMIQTAVKEKHSIVFKGIYHTEERRKRILEIGKFYNLPVYVIFIDASFDLVLKLNSNVPVKTVIDMYREVKFPVHEGFQGTAILHWYADEELDSLPKFRDTRNWFFSIFDVFKEYKCFSFTALKKRIEDFDWENTFPVFKKCINKDLKEDQQRFPLHEHLLLTAINASWTLDKIPKEKQNLFLTATFLHDIGKVETKQQIGFYQENSMVFRKGARVYLISYHSHNDDILVATRTDPMPYDNPYDEEYLSVDNAHELISISPICEYPRHDVLSANFAYRQLSRIGFEKHELVYIYDIIYHHMLLHPQLLMTQKIARNIVAKHKHILNELITLEFANLAALDMNTDILKRNVALMGEFYVGIEK